MVLKALIIISIMLQTLATIAAIRLVRLTKYNSIWILLIIGMAAMSVTRYGQYVQTFVDDSTAKAPTNYTSGSTPSHRSALLSECSMPINYSPISDTSTISAN